MNLEEALQWCIENQAQITFFYLQGIEDQPRAFVRVRGSGLTAERDTLIEAIDFLSSKQTITGEKDG